MRKIYVISELAKGAEEVLSTARKQGYVWDGGEWLQHIDNIAFGQAFTKKELRDHLRDFLYHTKEAVQPRLKSLRLKDIRIFGGFFIDLDSTNLSHASTYYAVVIELPAYVKPWLEQDQDSFTLEEIKQKRFDLV